MLIKKKQLVFVEIRDYIKKINNKQKKKHEKLGTNALSSNLFIR